MTVTVRVAVSADIYRLAKWEWKSTAPEERSNLFSSISLTNAWDLVG